MITQGSSKKLEHPEKKFRINFVSWPWVKTKTRPTTTKCTVRCTVNKFLFLAKRKFPPPSPVFRLQLSPFPTRAVHKRMLPYLVEIRPTKLAYFTFLNFVKASERERNFNATKQNFSVLLTSERVGQAYAFKSNSSRSEYPRDIVNEL